MSAIDYRPDIDGLRAVAVLAVLFHHLDMAGFSGGYVGVDVFFVISGYLITSIILPHMDADRFSLRLFYERRIRRILPALFLVLTATSVAALASYWPDRLTNYSQTLLAATLFVSNILFWSRSGYFDDAAIEDPLLHTWSLAVEEQFYLFFPLFLLTLARQGRWRTAWLWGLFGLSLATSIHDVDQSPISAFYLFPARLWELLLGALLAVHKPPGPAHRTLRETLGLVAAALMAWSITTFDTQTRFPGANALIPCVATAILIYNGHGGTSLINRVLGLRPLVYIGLISYSLYLWHWPVLVFTRFHSGEALSGRGKAAILVLAFILAVLSWRFVETPFRRVRGATRPWVFPATAGAMLIFSTMGLYGISADAWSPYFPANTLVEFTTEQDREQRKAYPVSFCGVMADGEHLPGSCRKFGRIGADRKLFIWGDSHATSWSPVFFELAEELGYEGTLVAVPGCPPLLGVRVPLGRGNNDNCSRAEDGYRIFDYLISSHPDVTFLVGRWSMYAHGLMIDGTLHHGHHRIAAPGDGMDNPPPAYSSRVLARQLETTVLSLKDHTRLVVLRSVPRQSHPIARIANAPAEQQKGMRLTRVEHVQHQSLVNTLIDDLQARGWTRSYDPARRLCDEDICHYGQDDTLYYLDSSHITATASMLFKQDLRPFLQHTSSSSVIPKTAPL